MKGSNYFDGRSLLMAAYLPALIVMLFMLNPIPARPELSLPAGFVSETVVSGVTAPVAIAWAPDGRMFIAQKGGKVRVFQNNNLLTEPFIDISSEVNARNYHRGLTGIAVHPNFPQTNTYNSSDLSIKPYVYLLYTYDPPGVVADGSGARVSRLIRVTAKPTNTNVALANSAVVLLGKNSTRENIGDETSYYGPPSCDANQLTNELNDYTQLDEPIQDCLPLDFIDHGTGSVLFGIDGSLFVSNGDGARNSRVDWRARRTYNLNSLSGKILRIDPLTGEGLSDNPFYDGDPDSNPSKVYSLGLRNPFRIAIHPESGEPFIADVGRLRWEEINTGSGKNFGWPCYEGSNTDSSQQLGYKKHFTTRAACAKLYAEGPSAVQRSLYAYNHSDGDGRVYTGAFYQGTDYPAQYHNALFIADNIRDWIKYLTFDLQGKATLNDFAGDVTPGSSKELLQQVTIGRDSNLYYVFFYTNPASSSSMGEIRRILYTGQ
jgi:Glucose/sorbosone dehydrogenases